MKKLKNISLTLFFTAIIVLGFAVPANMPPNGTWYQQFFPPLNGRTIGDITFTDSLNGYAVTQASSNDTNYILKSSNSGDNWSIVHKIYTSSIRPLRKIQFINNNTGFAGGNKLLKTTNGGINWQVMTIYSGTSAIDLFALNEDTLWYVDDIDLDGGLYRTTDKGASWIRQSWNTTNNPLRIYMYNARIGFKYYRTIGPLLKTTDGGFNWFNVNGGVFNDIYFVDSLTGWKSGPGMKKTTDGGLNWNTQTLPNGGIIYTNVMYKFSVLNKDTIWGCGGSLFYGGGRIRGTLYRTTNSGNNWFFTLPDTSYQLGIYYKVQFLNKNIGWGYGHYNNSNDNSNIHTTNGGDTTFLTGLTQISNEIPKEYKLYQNYPNPFNPKTNIKYSVKRQLLGQSGTSNVKLIIYDITGREIIKLVDKEQTAGTYNVDFTGSFLSTGVYFYQLIVNGANIATKKMILIK